MREHLHRFVGTVYRAHNPHWSWAPASGEGASRHGGRFNRKGQAALYTSLDIKTAWVEAQQGFPFKEQPLTICAYEVHCEGILDLRERGTLAALGIDKATLSCPWELLVAQGKPAPSHQLANDLIAQGTAGILVPSFAPGAVDDAANLVFWRWSRNRPHRVRVIDSEGRLHHKDLS